MQLNIKFFHTALLQSYHNIFPLSSHLQQCRKIRKARQRDGENRYKKEPTDWRTKERTNDEEILIIGMDQCSGDRQPGRRSLAPLSCGPPPPPLNTYEGGRIFCLDLFVKGQFICDVQ